MNWLQRLHIDSLSDNQGYKSLFLPSSDTGSVRGIQESLYDSVRHVKGLIGLGELEGQDNEGIGVPFFNFETILAATENFSDANKLGRGGYGPVYKVIDSVHLTSFKIKLLITT